MFHQIYYKRNTFCLARCFNKEDFEMILAAQIALVSTLVNS